MEKTLIVLCAAAAAGMCFLSYPNGALSALLIVLIAVPAVFLIKRYSANNKYLVNVFLVGLLLRIGLGVLIYVFDLRGNFGPDSYGYHNIGQRMAEIWWGMPVPDDIYTYRATHLGSSGWGMYYLVAAIYSVFGANFLIAQSFCGVIGALTAPMVYFCAEKIFKNQRVARLSALAVAVFPSFIIWSSQLLKDGLIIFLLVCTMVLILQLRKKLSYINIVLLIGVLICILSLRFYIFYMVVISVVGSFIIGLNTSVQSIARTTLIIAALGLAFTYLEIVRNASTNLEIYANLEQIQTSRLDLATSADSGFGEDIDVSTPTGAIAAVPIGLAYLLLAPFPWEVTKLNQVLVLPETFLWWALIPVMLAGLRFTLKHKLREAIPILIFSLMLTLSYSIFQGNVGMLYRQRTQIQVFLFIFIAVGWTLIQERKENIKLLRSAKEQKFRESRMRRIKV